jgi:hypothetical protein
VVDDRVVGRPRDSHRFLNLELWNLWLIWRPGEALRWKGEEHQVGRSRSVKWQIDTSKVIALVYVG